MSDLPIIDDESFDEVNYQGKAIQVGQAVVIQEAGRQKTVTVTSLVKRQGHYWVGYDQDQRFCPWPLVRLPKP
ncbi:MAG: hypothetical protein R3264_20890 [Anaerolineae bacterium]|nr:hypothetical protein [Anaerolineae bacterium]